MTHGVSSYGYRPGPHQDFAGKPPDNLANPKWAGQGKRWGKGSRSNASHGKPRIMAEMRFSGQMPESGTAIRLISPKRASAHTRACDHADTGAS